MQDFSSTNLILGYLHPLDTSVKLSESLHLKWGVESQNQGIRYLSGWLEGTSVYCLVQPSCSKLNQLEQVTQDQIHNHIVR